MTRASAHRAQGKRKLTECDGCGKLRSDVKCVGRDANGDPDAPCLCFVCRREAVKGRTYSKKHGRYVYAEDLWQ